MKRMRLLAPAVVAALLVSACGGSASSAETTTSIAAGESSAESAKTTCEQIMVEQAWVRVPPGDNTAFYAMIVNEGPTDVALESAESDFAGMYSLHETKMEGDEMKMQPVEGGRIVVPAGGSAILAPGGLHVMAMQVNRDLAEGDTVSMTLRFSNGCETTVDAPVQASEG